MGVLFLDELPPYGAQAGYGPPIGDGRFVGVSLGATSRLGVGIELPSGQLDQVRLQGRCPDEEDVVDDIRRPELIRYTLLVART